MEVTLTIQDGTSQRRVFRMRKPVMVIGRTKGCALKIPSASVSRHHCRLTVAKGIVQVRDLGSANGTFVNDRQVTAGVLRPGDSLRVGPITFKVEYPLTPEAVEQLLEKDAGLEPAGDALPEAIPLDDSQAAIPVPEEWRLEEMPLVKNDEVSETPTLQDEVRAGPKRKKKKKKKPETTESETSRPDYSVMMENEGGWQAPSGENLRDLLAKLEEEE